MLYIKNINKRRITYKEYNSILQNHCFLYRLLKRRIVRVGYMNSLDGLADMYDIYTKPLSSISSRRFNS